MMWYLIGVVPLSAVALVVLVVFVHGLRIRERRAVERLRKQGIPAAGFTWLMGFPATDKGALRHLQEGNLHHLVKFFCDRFKTRTFAGQFGRAPIVATLDPGMYEAAIRAFATFPNRSTDGLDLGPTARDTEIMKRTILCERDVDQWKRTRGLWTYWVSNDSSLRFYAPVMSRAVARLVQDISARADKGDYFDVTHELKRLGLDVVGRTAFGIDFLTPLRDMPNVQLSSKCPFADLKQVAEAFQKATDPHESPYAALGMLFYPFASLLRPLVPWFVAPSRLRVGESRVTLMKVSEALLAGGTGGKGGAVTPATGSFPDMLMQAQKSGNRVTQDQAIAQIWLLIIAGSETTALTLSYLLHLLAANPGIQDKLRVEILKTYADGEPSFERLEECAYLNASIKEVLRLYPPAPLHVRVADRDATLPMEDGRQLRVEEGTVLWFPNYYAHRDPKYWSDPEAFIPERFMADRPGGPEPSHPYAYSPFGLGPRACVGQKFALEEMKLATIEMLRRFRFEPMPGQKSSSEMPIRTGITMQPIEGIWIKATRLEQ